MTLPAAAWLPPGYSPIRLLGQGGIGEVWLVQTAAGGPPLALKRLKPKDSSGGGNDAADRRRFKREFLTLSRLRAPGIVRAFEWFESGADCCYSMAHIAGMSPAAHLGAAGGPLPAPQLARLWELADDLFAALGALHAFGLIHRDLKPANLLVDEAGRLQLIDFGLARPQQGDLGITLAGEVLGTPAYLSPEQIRNQPLDGRCDLYAAGVLLYELATGALPCPGGSVAELLVSHLRELPVPPRRHNGALSPALERFLLRLLDKNPARRFPSAPSARQALRDCVLGAADQGRETLTLRESPALIAEALERADPRADTGAGAAPLIAPYTGNGAAVAALRAVVDDLAAGRGGARFLAGPAGAGKSRLLGEIAAEARERGLRPFTGRAVESGALAGQSFQAIMAGLAQALQRHPDVRQGIDGRELAILAHHFPALQALVSEAGPPPAIDPGAERARLLGAFYGFFSRLTQAWPLVLVLEDLHWADPLSRELISHLTANFTRGAAVLTLLGSYRDDPEGPLGAPGHWLERLAGDGAIIRLAPLDGIEMGALIQAQLGLNAPPPEAFTRRLHALTGGNPKFCLETVQALIAAGTLRGGADHRLPDGGWDFTRALSGADAATLPPTVHAALRLRLQSLDENVSRVLAAAALLGATFRFGWWRALTGAGEDELLAAADAAIRRGFLREAAGDRLEFSHEQLRVALLSGMSNLQRRSLHGRALRALEADPENAPLELLAEHAIAAQDAAATQRHGHALMSRLLDRSEAELARVLFARIEAILPGGRPETAPAQLIHLELAVRLAHLREEPAAARTAALDGIECAQTLHDRHAEARLRRAAAKAEWGVGNYPACIAQAAAALPLEETPAARAETLQWQALGWMFQGDTARTRAFLDQAEAALDAGDDPMRRFSLRVTRGTLHLQAGEYDAARDCYSAALAAAETAQLPKSVAICLGNLGNLARDRGELTEAETLLTRARAAHQRIGSRTGMAVDGQNLANVYILRGDYALALPLLQEAAPELGGAGYRIYAGYCALYTAQARRGQGDMEAAAAARAGARELFSVLNYAAGLAEVLAEEIDTCQEAEDAAGAATHIKSLEDLLRHHPVPPYAPFLQAVNAWLCAATRRPPAADLPARDAPEMEPAAADNFEIALHCRLYAAQSRLLRGDAAAAAALEQLRDAAQAAGFQPMAARALRLLEKQVIKG